MTKRSISASMLLVLVAFAVQPVYANNVKVTICHKQKNTLEVDSHAVPAHLEHGDTVGMCGDVPF